MSSFLRPANRSHPHSRLPHAGRLRNLHPIAAASITALLLSACGGGDGSTSSTDGLQSDATTAKFESFVSGNPQVRATIASNPYGTKDDDLTGEEAERAAAEEEASEDEASEDEASQDGTQDDGSGTSGSGTSSTDSASDESSEGDAAGNGSDDDSNDDTASSGSSDSLVDTLIGDMREMNDLPLKDVNPKYGFSRGPGYVLAGIDAGGANNLLPWFVQFEGEGNAASHTRVEIRNMRVFVKSRSTDKWTRVIDSDSFGGIQCDQGSNYFPCPQQARVQEDGDSASTLPLTNLNLHGWWGAREPIEGWDAAAIVVSLQARLVKDREDGVDDRAKAKYLLHVGADFYPNDAPPDRILDAVGISRAKLVTNDWQTFALTTLNDVGLQEPGGGISSAELRANPPPMGD